MKDSFTDNPWWIILLAIIFLIAIIFGSVCLETWVYMLLWNWIAVSLFSAPVLTFWVSFGMLALLNIIGSFFRVRINKSND